MILIFPFASIWCLRLDCFVEKIYIWSTVLVIEKMIDVQAALNFLQCATLYYQAKKIDYLENLCAFLLLVNFKWCNDYDF